MAKRHTKLWQTDEELFPIIRKELFSCVVGDVMDKMGLQHQFLPPEIHALRPDMILSITFTGCGRGSELLARSTASPVGHPHVDSVL